MQFLINAFITGCIYITMSIPFLLYSKYFGWNNLTFAGIYSCIGVLFWLLSKQLGLTLWICIILTFIATIIVCITIHFVFDKLPNKNPTSVFVTSILVLDLIYNFILMFFGSGTRIIVGKFLSYNWFGGKISVINILTIFVSVLLIFICIYIFEISNLKLVLESIKTSEIKLQLSSIDTNYYKTLLIVWIGIFAWFGGIVTNLEYNTSLNLIFLGTKAWVISTLSKNNFWGLVIVSLLLSSLETIITLISPFNLKDVLIYIIVIIVISLESKNTKHGKLFA